MDTRKTERFDGERGRVSERKRSPVPSIPFHPAVVAGYAEVNVDGTDQTAVALLFVNSIVRKFECEIESVGLWQPTWLVNMTREAHTKCGWT